MATPLIPPSAQQQPQSARQTCSAIAQRALGGILQMILNHFRSSSAVIHKSITDEELGSSGKRSAEQARLAKITTADYLSKLPNTTLIVFTDGSALGNPGPCGAAAIIHTHGLDMEPVILSRAISRNSSSYHAELAAIDLALEYVYKTTLL